MGTGVQAGGSWGLQILDNSDYLGSKRNFRLSKSPSSHVDGGLSYLIGTNYGSLS